MSTPSPLASPQPWDLVAAAYEAEIVPMFEHFARVAMRLAGLPAIPRHASNLRIVDVACGPGTLAVLAAHAGYHVDAIDFSPAMIERLAARIAAEGTHTVTPRIGDGQALPYPDGGHAAAFSLFGLIFFPDRARGFAELRRVLVPGARAVVSSWHPIEATPQMAIVFAAMRDLMSALVPPGAAPGAMEPPPLTTADSCRAEMGAAFAGVEVHSVDHAMPYTSTADLWDSLQRTLAPVVLLKHKLGERWAPAADRIRATLERELGTGAGELTMHAWLTTGTAG
jgi:SAM-dependent methyltransferase